MLYHIITVVIYYYIRKIIVIYISLFANESFFYQVPHFIFINAYSHIKIYIDRFD